MTVLFSDVRGFTAISETFGNDPRGLMTLINRFLLLTNAIIAHNGTIDIHGRCDHGVLECAARRPAARKRRLLRGAGHARACGRAQSGTEREATETGTRFIPIKAELASIPVVASLVTWDRSSDFNTR